MAAGAPRALFTQGVRAVLGGWAALQLAVAQGFGGPGGAQKADWLVGALGDFFTQNADLEEEEVEQFLAEVMDNEFDTAVEDGSLQQVSRELLSLFSRASRGDVEGVSEALEALARRGPALRHTLATRPPRPPPPADAAHGPTHPSHSPTQGEEEEEQEEEEEEEEEQEAMECEAPAEGWTLVRRRRQR
ncbi:pre-rRNA-processing protein TSR2 homolog [Melanerpes formicivorus]|uniref:pre-rRNA-processing protein TSR2 homolog n=1 Tax=Melanerpes formicivorus TaxID=211600 RepID=UPI00359021A1